MGVVVRSDQSGSAGNIAYDSDLHSLCAGDSSALADGAPSRRRALAATLVLAGAGTHGFSRHLRPPDAPGLRLDLDDSSAYRLAHWTNPDLVGAALVGAAQGAV